MERLPPGSWVDDGHAPAPPLSSSTVPNGSAAELRSPASAKVGISSWAVCFRRARARARVRKHFLVHLAVAAQAPGDEVAALFPPVLTRQTTGELGFTRESGARC